MNSRFLFLFLSTFFSLQAVYTQLQVLDLKTPLAEKTHLSPAKIGAGYYLLKEGFKILDAGEDYAVWLSGYTQEKFGDQIRVELLVEITPTSALFKKPALASRKVSYSFPVTPPRMMDVDQASTVFLREKLERKTDLAVLEGQIGGKAVAEAVMDLLRSL